METVKAQVTIANRLGMHARPAMAFVDAASEFASDITVGKGSQVVNGKSIMELMMLAATQGTELEITAQGADAQSAITSLKNLVSRRFDEE